MPRFFLILYGLTRCTRLLFSVALLVALVLLILVFMLQFLPHPQKVVAPLPLQYRLMIVFESSTYAALEPLNKAIPTSFKYKTLRNKKNVIVELEFSPLIASFALLLIRFFLKAGLGRLEEFASERTRPRVSPISQQAQQREEGTGAKVSTRLSLLRDISKAKKLLEATKRYLAFLSADVVKSTQIKEGEDEVAIGSSFMAYKRFVESKVAKHGAWKQSWTPDGLMVAFQSIDQAISAGQEILSRLEDFNKNYNQLKTPFLLRLGVHGGELYFDSSDNLEEVSDRVIDVAGHLQKEAEINSLWTTQLDLEVLGEKGRFRQIGQEVDGYTVFDWSLAGSIGDLLTKQGLISKEQLDEAIAEQERSSKLLGEILIERGFLGEEEFIQILAKQLKVATVKVDAGKVETDVLRRFPKELAERLMAFPLSFRDGVLTIVSDSLIEVQLVRKLETWLGFKLNQNAIASRNNIRLSIEQGYRRLEGTGKV